MKKSLRKELGYNKYNEILPNRKVKKKDTETKRKVESEIKKYGYPKSDLWSMDTTSAIWLLEHLEMYLEIVGEFVDLNYHTFEIPVLIPDEDIISMIKYAQSDRELAYEIGVDLNLLNLKISEMAKMNLLDINQQNSFVPDSTFLKDYKPLDDDWNDI